MLNEGVPTSALVLCLLAVGCSPATSPGSVPDGSVPFAAEGDVASATEALGEGDACNPRSRHRCDEGLGCCEGSHNQNVCTALWTDEENCGGCGRRCSAGSICSDGDCIPDPGCAPELCYCLGACVCVLYAPGGQCLDWEGPGCSGLNCIDPALCGNDPHYCD